jgi:hypothetical protein
MATTGDPGQRFAARIAFRGAVLGALIGGLGSFGGSYFTFQSQEEQKVREQLEATYVEVLGEANEYRYMLGDVADAVRQADQESYRDARARVHNQTPVLYAAAVRADIVSDRDSIISDLVTELFAPNLYIDVKDCDVDQIQKAIDASAGLMTDLNAAAEDDLDR